MNRTAARIAAFTFMVGPILWGGGCGGGVSTTTTSSGAGGSATTTTSSGAGGSASTTTSSGAGGSATTTTSSGAGGFGGAGGASAGPCHGGGATCKAANTICLGLEENSAKMTDVGLRIGQLTITKPDALTSGALKLIVDKGVSENLTGAQYAGDPSTSCNLNGSGTFNWLLDFDLPAGTLKTGGAKPVGDPHGGYCFVNQMISGFQVQPATLDAKVGADGSFSVTTGQSLVVPMFLDAQATQQILFPLHQVRFKSAKLSLDHDCIGKYNGDEFSAANDCLPDPVSSPPQTFFTNAATLDAYITLEEADSVLVAAVNQSLCVLLSGNASMYGDGKQPSKCKRGAGAKIILEGDWCAATNAGATPACFDAFRMNATFAASSVKISGNCP